MSRERTPVLSGAIPSIESFMAAWTQLIQKHPRGHILERFISPGLVRANEYHQILKLNPTYAVAMGEFHFLSLLAHLFTT